MSDVDNCRKNLAGIIIEDLSDDEYLDNAISWAGLAIETVDKNDIARAVEYLKKSTSVWPFFSSIRDELLIELLETEPQKNRSRIKDMLAKLNEYLILCPNWNGLGLNINKMIDDMVSKGPKS